MNIILSSYAFMYWITTCDSILNACIWLCIISVCVLAFSAFSLLSLMADDCYDDEEIKYKRIAKIATIVVFITLFIAIFLPSEKQWYKIYGIGGTIEYVKNNPKAQQLPDKTINALNRYLDSFAEDSTKTIK